MKIYQVHDYGGEWEDRWDIIVATYLSQEKAIKRVADLEKEQLHSKRCKECPLYFCPSDCTGDCDICDLESINWKEKVNSYCDRYEAYGEDLCANYDGNYNESYFKIEEIEVIE